MLHRLALRVLPSLTLAVTEDSVRTRKRVVMFVPGLVAFAVYRAAKHVTSLSEPLTLLLLSGLVSLATAICAYRVGRTVPFSRLIDEDGVPRIVWVLAWIGFVYGVQLSLLVLALLWLVGYDYAKHPDGPAMMAIIIPCTAVARDAFEIGHIRWLERSGRPFATFPDGVALRALLRRIPPAMMQWLGLGVVSCVGLSLAVMPLVNGDWAVLVEGALVTLVAGTVALPAFLSGQAGGRDWVPQFTNTGWGELLKFWWWPGLAFASTYYLVLVGSCLYVLKQPVASPWFFTTAAAVVGAVMALYCYYLGDRRDVENRERGSVSGALLRCPFVMGILGKSREALVGPPLSEPAAAFEKHNQRVSS
ncbi:MAG: hypothetical protein NBKEAIPA_02726 [Nitrospirae bacterium]|nr:hypothetical protein [Nitrospirota bacterium]MEB2339474.1 hypothetical protein [Nitrospirales bacterium]